MQLPTRRAIHRAAAAKSTAVLNTHMRLIMHLCVLPAGQYTRNATQPSMNHQTVSSLHHRARTPAHRFLKPTTKYLLNHKMTHCSTYTTSDLPPTLPARLALWKAIETNKYRPLKSSKTTSNIPLRPLPNKYKTTRRFLPKTLHYITSLSCHHPPLNAQRCSCQIQCNV